MAYILRDYQQQAVDATLKHFRKSNESAVIVLPTGAGKSLVIAELARLAKGRVLVLAHVKELVEQNYEKYCSYGLEAGIYSAGLNRKEQGFQVTFASIQSFSRNLTLFTEHYSLVIIDECHRVALNTVSLNSQSEKSTQYHQVLTQLNQHNAKLKVLGLTATPYRMGLGWVYQKHYRGFARSLEPRPFVHCIYELPLRYMLNHGYLTAPKIIDASIQYYDFSSLTSNHFGHYKQQELNDLLGQYPRVTQGIIEHVKQLAHDRKGVMIFAATVEHAEEINSYLSSESVALITGKSKAQEREQCITDFKAGKIKYLLNVSVLTTGFDAPHVDFIAILRPTESVSLYQQIIGRGLRLSEGKSDCLIVDYAGNDYDIFQPEVGFAKPESKSVPVMVNCPVCDYGNVFWGKVDEAGNVIEHYGRRCWALNEHGQLCEHRFVFKQCPHCLQENDIAARSCLHCHKAIIDPDEQLKQALQLKDALVLRCVGMDFSYQGSVLKITYYDEDATSLDEFFDFNNKKQKALFMALFAKRYFMGAQAFIYQDMEHLLTQLRYFKSPDFVIARKAKNKKKPAQWRVRERLFDYQGLYRLGHQL